MKTRAEDASEKPAIAIIVAHPDDCAHAMGGTAWLLKDNYRLHVFCATRGERGYRDPEGRTGPDKPPSTEVGAIRSEEEASACRLLGAELTFLDLVNDEIYADREVICRVADMLKDLGPVAVFTLWPVNVPDHVITSAIATAAMRRAGIFHTTQVYFFENGVGGQTNQFIPDLYVNITDVIEHKRELVRCHRSQNPDEAAVEDVLKRNVMRGLMARCDYAEPFKTPDPLVNARWGRKARYLLLNL